MADVQHSGLTGSDLHEPKGAASAGSGEVYVADGLGSGNWRSNPYRFGGYIGFDSSTPAYQHSATTSDTVLNPSFTSALADGFTLLSSPNMRVVYTGTPDVYGKVNFDISMRQQTGADRNVELVVYKNGSAESGSRQLFTTVSGDWVTMSLQWNGSLSTNDYIEVFIRIHINSTVEVANAYLMVEGFTE